MTATSSAFRRSGTSSRFIFTCCLPILGLRSRWWCLALLTFLPTRYSYPSTRPAERRQQRLAIGWAGLCAWVLWVCPRTTSPLRPRRRVAVRPAWQASLYYPAFYMAASWAVSLKLWAKAKKTKNEERPTEV